MAQNRRKIAVAGVVVANAMIWAALLVGGVLSAAGRLTEGMLLWMGRAGKAVDLMDFAAICYLYKPILALPAPGWKKIAVFVAVPVVFIGVQAIPGWRETALFPVYQALVDPLMASALVLIFAVAVIRDRKNK